MQNKDSNLEKNHQNSPPKLFVCVGSVVLKNEQVLFIRQAKGESLEGQWSIPWGFVDSNETPEDAAIRETLEESGIQAKIDGFLGFQNLPQTGWIGLVFLCRHLEGVPKADNIETDKAVYFSKNELLNMDQPIEQWCRWIALRILDNEYSLIRAVEENPYQPKIAFI